jgi:hypothetical protein
MFMGGIRNMVRPLLRTARGVSGKPHSRSILTVIALLVSTAVTADSLVFNSGKKQVTLLELYTSQGCSSCPPAERWFNEYVDDDGLWARIVPVAFHVDYWDYIGWKDSYATPENGERQRDYARAGKARTVYTPGVFTNGRELRLNPRSSDREPGNLAVTVANGLLRAEFSATKSPLDLHVALLGAGLETRVAHGENRNRTLAQEFVVLAHEVHSSATGQWAVTVPADARAQAGRYGLAVWVSESGKPTPLQATGGWLPE